MTEPLAVGTVGSVTHIFSGLYEHFKPSRSPYLLSGLLSILALNLVAGLSNSEDLFLLVFIPVGIIFTFLSVLCFYFHPSSLNAEESEELKKLRSEMNDQFKFSRTICLSGGILILAYLVMRALGHGMFSTTGIHLTPIPTGLFFWIAYAASVIHLLIFSCYIFFRNVQEESVVKISLFQITFFTLATLVGFVFATKKLVDQSSLIRKCTVEYEYTTGEKHAVMSDSVVGCLTTEADAKADFDKKKADEEGVDDDSFKFKVRSESYDPAKLLFWYLLLHVFVFEAYWFRRLISVVKFKVDLVILE
jgi:hypothetical protein